MTNQWPFVISMVVNVAFLLLIAHQTDVIKDLKDRIKRYYEN